MIFRVVNGRPCFTPMKEKCDAIRNLKAPRNVKEVRSFCGMVNFLSNFLKDLRKVLIPIYDLMHKRKHFEWTEACQAAFDQIKDQLQQPPVLNMPKAGGHFWLESDTSTFAAGAALYQEQENRDGTKEYVLVGYHSKRMPQEAKNYGITELELMGMVINVHGFKH